MDKWMEQAKREILAIRLRYKKMLYKLEYITDTMRSIVDSITHTIPEIHLYASRYNDYMFYRKSFKSNEYDSLIGTPNFKEKWSGHRILLYVEIKYIDNNDRECDPKDFSKVCKGLIRIYAVLDSIGDDIDSMEILVSYDDTEDCCVMNFYTDEWNPTIDKYDWDESWVEEGETRATFKQEDIDLLASLKSVIRKPKPEVIITNDTNIAELGFQIKVFNMLMRRLPSPYNVGQLKNLTIGEISSIRGMGPFYLNNFVETIDKWGIELRKEEESE